MKADKHHIQVRVSARDKKKLHDVSRKMEMPLADVVRGVIFFGLPTLVAMDAIRGDLIKKLVTKLKGEARLRLSR